MHISVCTVVCSESFDVLASLGEMQVENRRLLEKEKQLEDNLEQTEEQLRALQTENLSLMTQLQGSVEHLWRIPSECMCVMCYSLQHELVKVEILEKEKSAITQSRK